MEALSCLPSGLKVSFVVERQYETDSVIAMTAGSNVQNMKACISANCQQLCFKPGTLLGESVNLIAYHVYLTLLFYNKKGPPPPPICVLTPYLYYKRRGEPGNDALNRPMMKVAIRILFILGLENSSGMSMKDILKCPLYQGIL